MKDVSTKSDRQVSVITLEEENYLRIVILIIKVAKRAVRVIFDKEFHPLALQNEIRSNHRVLMNLKTKRIINHGQWKLLFPTEGK